MQESKDEVEHLYDFKQAEDWDDPIMQVALQSRLYPPVAHPDVIRQGFLEEEQYFDPALETLDESTAKPNQTTNELDMDIIRLQDDIIELQEEQEDNEKRMSEKYKPRYIKDLNESDDPQNYETIGIREATNPLWDVVDNIGKKTFIPTSVVYGAYNKFLTKRQNIYNDMKRNKEYLPKAKSNAEYAVLWRRVKKQQQTLQFLDEVDRLWQRALDVNEDYYHTNLQKYNPSLHQNTYEKKLILEYFQPPDYFHDVYESSDEEDLTEVQGEHEDVAELRRKLTANPINPRTEAFLIQSEQSRVERERRVRARPLPRLPRMYRHLNLMPPTGEYQGVSFQQDLATYVDTPGEIPPLSLLSKQVILNKVRNDFPNENPLVTLRENETMEPRKDPVPLRLLALRTYLKNRKKIPTSEYINENLL